MFEQVFGVVADETPVTPVYVGVPLVLNWCARLPSLKLIDLVFTVLPMEWFEESSVWHTPQI